MAGTRPGVVAHRGASADHPEHSRAAFLAALAAGADGLEADLRRTADDVLVCWHDATVDRTTGGSGPVRAHTLAQLRELTLAGGREPAGEEVVTVRELVALAAGAGRPVHLALELKHPEPDGFVVEDALVALLVELGWDPVEAALGDVSVSLMSFHPDALEHLAAHVPARHLMALTDELDAAQAVAEHAPGLEHEPWVVAAVQRLVGHARELVDEGRVGGAGPSVAYARAHPEQVRRWVADGRRVRVWTVDAPDDVALCRELGVAEVTTNVPARVLALLAEPAGR